MEPKREYTIKLRFGAQARNPNNTEIFKFLHKQGWTSEDLSAMYREDHSVYVRFKTEPAMRGALLHLGPRVKFDYDDGTSMEVEVQAAAGTFKYVRIFGLPPEVDDRQIVATMSKYGKVQQLVRERYPVETGFPIWNGVRGVHVELVSEIPAQLTIQHCKARIYYDGLQNKCFGCGALDHLKAACPKRNSVNKRLTDVVTPAGGSYANIVENGAPVSPVGETPKSGMVVLNTKIPAPQKNPNLEENHVEKTILDEDKSSQAEPANKGSSTPTDLPVAPTQEQGHGDEAAEESGDQSMDEEDEEQPENAETPSNNPMETDDAWTEAKKKGKGNGKGKRGRPRKTADSDASESDARGGKQFIVPAQGHDLLEAQSARTQTRSASVPRKPNNNK